MAKKRATRPTTKYPPMPNPSKATASSTDSIRAPSLPCGFEIPASGVLSLSIIRRGRGFEQGIPFLTPHYTPKEIWVRFVFSAPC